MSRPPCLCDGRADIRCDASHCDLASPIGAPGDSDRCVICWQYHHSPPHNALWGGSGIRATARGNSSMPCIHLGGETGERRNCPTCQGHVEVKLRECALHGQCSTRKKLDNIACCAGCPDRETSRRVAHPGTIRHLAYFVYPAAHNKGEIWRWNIARLKRRLSLFNGRRIVGIATDGSTEPAAAVREILAGCGCEFIEKCNDPALKEVTLYADLLAHLSDCTGPEHAFFYGHAKGVTSRGWSAAQGNRRGVRQWTEALYETCLDYWPAVARLLEHYPVAGPFKRVGYRFNDAPAPKRCSWHYSGSFRWHRCADLFARDWRNVQPHWCGGEMQPGELFRADEAACIMGEFQDYGLALYTDEFWDRWASTALDQFHEEHLPQRRQPLLMTCVLASHRKPGFVHQAIASVVNQSCPDWQLIVIDSGDLYDAGEFARYTDPRILITTTGETSDNPSTQGWAINECFRRGLVRGDLACYLSDDDVYQPWAFETFLDRARTHPDESAWYGLADRCEIRRDGSEVKLGELPLPPVAPGTNGGIGGVSLDEKADGGQVCHRIATAYEPWPEARERNIANHCDGLWMDAVGRKATIHALMVKVLRHRHTALSTFTTSSDAR
jgi:hypothetical protein